MPLAAVRLPARDRGRYLARFSGVSATGPLLTVEDVMLAPEAASVLVVAEVSALAPVEAFEELFMPVEPIVSGPAVDPLSGPTTPLGRLVLPASPPVGRVISTEGIPV